MHANSSRKWVCLYCQDPRVSYCSTCLVEHLITSHNNTQVVTVDSQIRRLLDPLKERLDSVEGFNPDQYTQRVRKTVLDLSALHAAENERVNRTQKKLDEWKKQVAIRDIDLWERQQKLENMIRKIRKHGITLKNDMKLAALSETYEDMLLRKNAMEQTEKSMTECEKETENLLGKFNDERVKLEKGYRENVVHIQTERKKRDKQAETERLNQRMRALENAVEQKDKKICDEEKEILGLNLRIREFENVAKQKDQKIHDEKKEILGLNLRIREFENAAEQRNQKISNQKMEINQLWQKGALQTKEIEKCNADCEKLKEEKRTEAAQLGARLKQSESIRQQLELNIRKQWKDIAECEAVIMQNTKKLRQAEQNANDLKEKFAQADAKLNYIKQENKGFSATLKDDLAAFYVSITNLMIMIEKAMSEQPELRPENYMIPKLKNRLAKVIGKINLDLKKASEQLNGKAPEIVAAIGELMKFLFEIQKMADERS